MAQYAVLIYATDSADGADARPDDLQVHDRYAKEVVAGIYVIEAADLDAALRIAGRNPVTQQGGGVEVWPVAGGFVRPPAHG